MKKKSVVHENGRINLFWHSIVSILKASKIRFALGGIIFITHICMSASRVAYVRCGLHTHPSINIIYGRTKIQNVMYGTVKDIYVGCKSLRQNSTPAVIFCISR